MKIDGGEAKLVFILLLFLIANFAVIINQSTDISAALPDRNNNTNITSTQTTTTKKDNDYKTNETGIISNAASPGNSTDDSECVNYDNHTRTINVCSGKLSLTKLSSILNNPGVLNRTSTKNWFLNANILVRGADSILFINSTDTDWLKINSTGGTAYSISVRGKGSLVIDHTKITSWNSTSNTVTNLKSHTEPKRAFLMISISGSHMNITNSNLSYLGYLTYTKSGGDNGTTTGIAYYGGNGSVIKNNLISFNHRGFYSRAVSNIAFENNRVYNNFEYGLDPHTGTTDIKIYSNSIYNNGAHGLI